MPAHTCTRLRPLATGAIALILVSALVAGPAVSKPKYEHTGQLIYFHGDHDHVFSSEVNGHTYSWVCDTGTTSTNCSEGTGIYWTVKLDDGSEVSIGGKNTPLDKNPLNPVRMSFWVDGFKEYGDPLLNMMLHAKTPGHTDTEVIVATFHYRLGKYLKFRTICLPYNKLDDKGHVKGQGEACYLAP